MVVKSCKSCGSPFDARGRALYCSIDCKAAALKEQRRQALLRFKDSNPDYFPEYLKERQGTPEGKAGQAEADARRDKEARNEYARLARASGWWHQDVRTGSQAGDVPKDEAKLLEFLRKEKERLGL